MRRLLLGLFVLVAVVALVVGLTLKPSAAPAAAPVVGRQAPNFTLPVSNERRDVALSDYRGRVVLLNFFATWCIPCTHEMPEIERAFQTTSRRLVVLGVDKQEPAGDVNLLRKQLHIRYPLLLDQSLTAWQKYRVSIQPVSFWIDARGTVRAIHYGPMSTGYIKKELNRLEA